MSWSSQDQACPSALYGPKIMCPSRASPIIPPLLHLSAYAAVKELEDEACTKLAVVLVVLQNDSSLQRAGATVSLQKPMFFFMQGDQEL